MSVTSVPWRYREVRHSVRDDMWGCDIPHCVLYQLKGNLCLDTNKDRSHIIHAKVTILLSSCAWVQTYELGYNKLLNLCFQATVSTLKAQKYVRMISVQDFLHVTQHDTQSVLGCFLGTCTSQLYHWGWLKTTGQATLSEDYLAN